MNKELLAYKKINLILAGVILGIFLYSGIFNYKKSNQPLPSNYTQITGKESISTGLSRSFSAIVRLDFNSAKKYNPYGISLFLFFTVQLFLRLFFLGITKKSFFDLKLIVLIDAILSIASFILHFEPFINDLVHR